MAISYFKDLNQVAAIIQGKMSEVRPAYKNDFYDTILILMDDGGSMKKIVVISQGSLKYDMNTAKNGLLWVGNDVYFAGWSYGFETDRQTLQKPIDSPDNDVYIYKYRFG